MAPPKIKPKVGTRENDKGYKQILANIKAIKSSYVKGGFPVNSPETKDKHIETQKGDNGGDYSPLAGSSNAPTVLDIAIWSEFGTSNMPERSFIRKSFEENKAKYKKTADQLLSAIMDGKITLDNALDRMGLMLQTDIKKFLVDGKVKPKSKRAELEENGKTLVDTAQMMQSITYKKHVGKVKAFKFRGIGKI